MDPVASWLGSGILGKLLNLLQCRFSFIYLFVVVVDLRCCAAFLSLLRAGALFIVVHKLLIAVASLVAGHRL